MRLILLLEVEALLRTFKYLLYELVYTLYKYLLLFVFLPGLESVRSATWSTRHSFYTTLPSPLLSKDGIWLGVVKLPVRSPLQAILDEEVKRGTYCTADS